MLINIGDFIKRESILDTPYQGRVVDIDDPLKLGRVKCEIEGLMSGPSDRLPWISQRSFMGGSLGKGSFFVPALDSILEIHFPFDDIYFGFYVGFWQSNQNKISVFDEDYPTKFGIFDNGFEASYNGEKQEFKVKHPSGSEAIITQDGTMTFNSSNEYNINANGNVTITSGGNVVIEPSGNSIIGGQRVILAGGALGVARLGDKSIGTGNAGYPVVSNIVEASKKVFAS